MISRRSFAAGLAASVAAIPLASAAQPAMTSVHIGTVPAEFGAQVYYALEMGFFKKNGLEVTIDPFTSGGAIASAVASGALDVGVSDTVSMISAHAHGLPFVYLAPGVISTTPAPLFAIVVPPNSTIREAKDLNNKTFGINAIQNISQVPTEFWIDKNGGASKSVKWVEIPFQATLPALAQGRLDVALLTEPFVTQAAHDGYYIMEMTKNTLAPVFLGGGWITSKDWLAKNPGTASAFMAAMAETATWANHNASGSADVLAKYTHIPLPVVQKTRRYLVTEKFDPSIVQPVIDACAQYGIIPKSFAASELFYRKS